MLLSNIQSNLCCRHKKMMVSGIIHTGMNDFHLTSAKDQLHHRQLVQLRAACH